MQQKNKKIAWSAGTIREELIGIHAKITESKNKATQNIEGTIIDETKNTITIKTKNKAKKIIKDQIISMIQESNDGKEPKKITGKQMQARPEERIKK